MYIYLLCVIIIKLERITSMNINAIKPRKSNSVLKYKIHTYIFIYEENIIHDYRFFFSRHVMKLNGGRIQEY